VIWAVADATCRHENHDEGELEDQDNLERQTVKTPQEKPDDEEGDAKKTRRDDGEQKDRRESNEDEGDDDDEGDGEEPREKDDPVVESSGCRLGPPAGPGPVWLLLLMLLLARRRGR
jgi:MYXO-CTERM domain-containing protein